MNVTTISMPANTARRKYIEYRDAVRKPGHVATDADRALMLSYRVLSQGRRILNLYDVMRVAGVDYENRPRLAVAQADLTSVRFAWLQRRFRQVPVFGEGDAVWYKKSLSRVVLPGNTFPRPARWFSVNAQVPSIPPRLRPKLQLHNYHLLWEAEWHAPPRDPILLKRVHGLLFVVLAQWDLTELEQSVLGLARADT